MSSTHSSARSRASFGQPLTRGPEDARRLAGTDRRYAQLGSTVTPREIEVLELVAAGMTNIEVGQKLFISEETVKSHVRHCLAKLGARTRTHAVAVAFKEGIIDLRHVEPPPKLERRRPRGSADRAFREAAERRVRETIREEIAAAAPLTWRARLARMWRQATRGGGSGEAD